MIQLSEKPVITLARNEVWKISVAGMAKKYTIPYAHLFKQIKAANLQMPFRILDVISARKANGETEIAGLSGCFDSIL